MRIEPGKTVLGDQYRLERKLGDGGFGEAWLATNLARGNAEVVVKVLDAGHRDVDQTFHNEAKTLMALDHRDIPRLEAVSTWPTDTEGEYIYLVQEKVDGRTLDDVQRPLPWRRAVEIVVAVARVLTYVHDKGVVHRDISPGNIMLSSADPKRVHLIDFGIAKRTRAMGESGTLRLYGKPAFVAPERYTGRHDNWQIDIFGLGAVLLYMLGGAEHATGPLGAEERARILADAGLPATVADRIRAMVSDAPDDRPSAQAVADDLAAALVTHRIESTPTNALEPPPGAEAGSATDHADPTPPTDRLEATAQLDDPTARAAERRPLALGAGAVTLGAAFAALADLVAADSDPLQTFLLLAAPGAVALSAVTIYAGYQMRRVWRETQLLRGLARDPLGDRS